MRDLYRTRILIISDSITLGVTEIRGNEIVDRVDSTYVDLLRDRMPNAEFIIDADVRRTTVDATNRIDALLAEHHPDVVLLMIGGSDADINWRRFVVSDGRIVSSGVPVMRYAANLRTLVARIHMSGARAILTDIHNHCLAIRGPYLAKMIGKDVTALLERSGGQAESDRRLERYCEAVDKIARETNCEVVAYGREMHRHPPEQVLGVDGMHPNGLAHRLIADMLAPMLVQRTRAVSAAQAV